MSACRRVLAPQGIYVGISGGGPATSSVSLVFDIAARTLLSRFVSQTLTGFTARSRPEDLATLSDLISSGRVTPVIDRRFPLSDLSEAIRYLEAGHARGKVIITVG